MYIHRTSKPSIDVSRGNEQQQPVAVPKSTWAVAGCFFFFLFSLSRVNGRRVLPYMRSISVSLDRDTGDRGVGDIGRSDIRSDRTRAIVLRDTGSTRLRQKEKESERLVRWWYRKEKKRTKRERYIRSDIISCRSDNNHGDANCSTPIYIYILAAGFLVFFFYLWRIV